MKLVLDQTACQGYGVCQQAAPDLVDLDEWGYAGLLVDGDVPADQHGPAQQAIDACPAAALKVGR